MLKHQCYVTESGMTAIDSKGKDLSTHEDRYNKSEDSSCRLS